MVSELETITAPAVEPLSLLEAKAHLRVDHDDEDDDILAKIREAREMAESFTRTRLITQSVRLTFDAFGPTLKLPVWPVQSITSVLYDDADGVAQTLDPSLYTLIFRKPREIGPAYSAVWPTTRPHWGAVRVTLVTGYGDNPADVPPAMVAAIKLLLGSLYHQREAGVIGTINSEISGMTAARHILAPHVLWF